MSVIELRLEGCRVPQKYRRMTRGAWDDARRPWPEAVTRWAKGEKGCCLVLQGTAGVGKTHIAVALLAHYIASDSGWVRPARTSEGGVRVDACYVTAAELAAEYQTGRFTGRPLLRRAIDSAVVVVDDAGWNRETLADLEGGALAELIMATDGTGYGLVITTNLPAERLGKLSGPLVSRLSSGILVQLDGEDLR